MKHSIDAIGIDASPFSCFAARVKTNWRLTSQRVATLATSIHRLRLRKTRFWPNQQTDATFRYLNESGMIARGWVNDGPVRQVIALKRWIRAQSVPDAYKRLMMLALADELVHGVSNVKFGPELYCGQRKNRCSVAIGVAARLSRMAHDLDEVRAIAPRAMGRVQCGDSRVGSILRSAVGHAVDAVICSPPYPAEHDYTRNGRLELALLEAVVDTDSLRRVKKQMIRSHTKGIYATDQDGRAVRGHRQIQSLARAVAERAASKTHGFARLYSTVVTEYFGGMKRHLKGAKAVLRAGGRAAYVVGDQASYLGIHIPTAEILGSLAEELGLRVVGIEQWRDRRSSGTGRIITEHILLLERVDSGRRQNAEN